MKRALPLVATFMAALALRLYPAATTELIFDETDEWIRVAKGISLTPGEVHLPIREGHHPALAAYFIRLGSLVFGTSDLGYRSASIVFGLLTIAVACRMAWVWFGRGPAVWTAVLLAFNEYHIGVSIAAVALVFYLFFAACAVFAYGEAVRSSRPWLLIVTGALTGLAFLCTEIGTLLIPVWLLGLIVSGRSSWFRKPEPYLAALAFGLVVAPDVVANVWTPHASDVATSYGDHFARFGGIGFNPQSLLFWFRDAAEWGFAAMGHLDFEVPAREYPGMNLLFGVILVTASAAATWRIRDRPVEVRVLVLVVWVVFGFFSLILPGTPRDLDPSAWFWVDVTLVPSVLLAGAMLDRLRGWRRALAWTAAAGAIVISTTAVVVEHLDLNVRGRSANQGLPAPAHLVRTGPALPGTFLDLAHH